MQKGGWLVGVGKKIKFASQDIPTPLHVINQSSSCGSGSAFTLPSQQRSFAIIVQAL